MLEALGLDTHVEGVYREMLADPTGGVAEMGARLGLAEEQVREALDRLVDLELLTASRDNAGGLRAVSPEAGLEQLLRRQEEDLLRRQQELALSKAAAARAVAEYAACGPTRRPTVPSGWWGSTPSSPGWRSSPAG